jgi:hypothetical protein
MVSQSNNRERTIMSKVNVYHVSGIPAGSHNVVGETKNKITVEVNGLNRIFSKNTKRQLGTPNLTLTYRPI